MRVLVTGSRDWADRDSIRSVLDTLLTELPFGESLTVVHGACPRGADRWADEWARNHPSVRVDVERHPADWEGPCDPAFGCRVGHRRKRGNRDYCPMAGHRRNQHMVNLGPDVVLAFFQPGAKNSGTTDCVRRAGAADIPARRYPEEPTAEEWAAHNLEDDETPALQARRDQIQATKETT